MSNRNLLNLPKEVVPRPARTASAPYNFVPLPEVVVTAVDDPEELPDHDTYADARYPHTGYFQVRLTTRSPLYVRCPLRLTEFLRQEREEDSEAPYAHQVKNKPAFFYTRHSESPVIPGSSLRGMLRTVLAIASYGKVGAVADSPKIFYRAVAAPGDDPLREPYNQALGRGGSRVRAGYLVRRGDDWYLRPAKRPADLNLPDRGSFLKIKERRIPGGALPGLRCFDDPNYRPQYHAVSFEVQRQIDARGKPFSAVSRIGPVDAGHQYRGVLVCSGSMLETGGEGACSPRRNHWLVLECDGQAALIRIAPQAVQDYRDSLTAFQADDPFDRQDGCLVDERPIFYVESPGEVHLFGHTPNFRVPALLPAADRAATPLDFVPPELRQVAETDYAEAIFGYTKGSLIKAAQGTKTRAYAGRVFVTDARLTEDQTGIWLSDEPIVPKILATPKPTAFQHYLVQASQEKRQLKHYGSQPVQETVIRGHKLYWHQGDRTVADLRAEPGSSNVDSEGNVNPQSKQHTLFRPVRSGIEFCFRIYFDNLSDRELGALCWVLHPAGDDGVDYCHSLGMAKPLGMGAVQLHATLQLTDRARRYGALFAGGAWETGIEGPGEELRRRELLYERARHFEEHVLEVLGEKGECSRLRDLRRIATLLKLMEWPGFPPEPPLREQPDNGFLAGKGRPNTRYMRIQEPNEYRNRPILPDPSAFGPLTGEVEPAGDRAPQPNAGSPREPAAPPQAAPPQVPAPVRRETKRERVVLLTAIKDGRAQVRTEDGQELRCTGLPPIQQGDGCRAEVTRERGQAVGAVFKSWW